MYEPLSEFRMSLPAIRNAANLRGIYQVHIPRANKLRKALKMKPMNNTEVAISMRDAMNFKRKSAMPKPRMPRKKKGVKTRTNWDRLNTSRMTTGGSGGIYG